MLQKEFIKHFDNTIVNITNYSKIIQELAKYRTINNDAIKQYQQDNEQLDSLMLELMVKYQHSRNNDVDEVIYSFIEKLNQQESDVDNYDPTDNELYGNTIG